MSRTIASIKCQSIVFALTLACALIGCSAAGGDSASDAAIKGKPAPDFSLSTLDGKTVKLSADRGSVVVLDFWATWCGPCKETLPHIQAISADRDLAAKGLKVYTVNSGEPAGDIKPFIEQNKFTFTVLMDPDNSTYDAYKLDGIPATVVIGRNGIVQDVIVGYAVDETAKEVDQAIDKALASR